jgi:hypothetical protein
MKLKEEKIPSRGRKGNQKAHPLTSTNTTSSSSSSGISEIPAYLLSFFGEALALSVALGTTGLEFRRLDII